MRWPRALVVYQLLTLLALIFTLAHGFVDCVDLHMEDELRCYLAGGRQLVRSGAAPIQSYSPVSAFAYGLITLLPRFGLHEVDCMYWATVLAAPLACWWALRPLVGPLLSWCGAAWLASTGGLLQAARIGGMAIPHVYAFTAIWGLLAVGACARGWRCTALLALGVAAINRSEFLLWFVVFGILLSMLPGVAWRRWQRAVVALAVLALGAWLVSDPGFKARSWLAFCQHYREAEAFAAAGGVPGDHEAWQRLRLVREAAFADPTAFVSVDFPTAASLPAAAMENPSRLAHHAVRNLLALPGEWFAAQAPWFLPRSAWPWFLLLLALLIPCRRRRGVDAPRLDPPAGGSMPVKLLLATSPLALIGALVVAPRGELLWPVFALWMVAALQRIGCWSMPAVARRMASLGIPALVCTVVLLSPRPFGGNRPELQHRQSCRLLLDDPPVTGARLYAPWSGYAEAIDRSDVQVMVVNLSPELIRIFDLGRAGDLLLVNQDTRDKAVDWPATAAALEASPRWRERRHAGSVVLYEFVPKGP